MNVIRMDLCVWVDWVDCGRLFDRHESILHVQIVHIYTNYEFSIMSTVTTTNKKCTKICNNRPCTVDLDSDWINRRSGHLLHFNIRIDFPLMRYLSINWNWNCNSLQFRYECIPIYFVGFVFFSSYFFFSYEFSFTFLAWNSID